MDCVLVAEATIREYVDILEEAERRLAEARTRHWRLVQQLSPDELAEYHYASMGGT